ncbi:MAG: phage holin family protein [Gemmatimonadota bacterium]|jgi:putative membrane protein|nr:phage holin family protein [Gemmatimonadota bacterium]
MGLLIDWLILTVAVWVTAVALPGFHVRSFKDAIVVALLVGLLNFLLGWLLFAVFTVATLGIAWILSFITRWIINAIILRLVDSMTDRLTIDGFKWALIGALVISIVSMLGDGLIRGF